MHCILVTLNGTLLWLLRAEAQRTQNPPCLGLAKTYPVQTFDEGCDALECPQLSTKPMLRRTLQQRLSNGRELLYAEFGWTPPLAYLS